MSTKTKYLKHPEHHLANNMNELPIHEVKTEDHDTLADKLASINKYLDAGQARGRAHSKAAVVNGKPGYFFVASLHMENGVKRECILFSTLVDADILFTDLS
jgi:hypothetical protein